MVVNQTSGVSPEQSPQAKQRMRPRGRRAFRDLPAELYIKGKLDYIDRLNEDAERQRIFTYVTLTKRYRGDHFGFFSSDDTGRWIDVKDIGLKKVNVVAPVVRANNKNWMEASVKLEVNARTSDPEAAGGADIAQSLVEMLCGRDWDEQLEEMISELAQLSGEYFLYSRYNKDLGPKLRVPQMATRDHTVDGSYYCANCNKGGKRQQAFDAGGCPDCAKPVTLQDPIEMKGLNVPDGYEEESGGDSETRLFTSYEMKVDERNAKGGDLSKCRWIRNNYLAYRNELEEMRPWALLERKGSNWSVGLQQQRALETSAQTGDNANGQEDNGDRDEDLLDYRRYWLDPKAVAGWVAPSDYSFGSEEYGYVFTIKAGQTFADVFPEGFEGLYIERIGDEVLYIGNEDFRKHWSVGHWQMDATSFWGKAQEDLLDLQEMRIEMVNIFFQAGMTMSMPPLIIDGMMFDGEDFVNEPGKIIRTRKGFARDGKPISDYLHQLEAQEPGSGMFSFYQLLVQSTDESSGVSPVSVGQGDPANKTFGGQQLLTQRAVGLLVPSQKNKARAKREWAYQHLELIQKYWTVERYKPIKSKFGDEWKQADVEAFRNANIREDYEITYVEGSEIPQSLEQREIKLVGLLQSGVLTDPTVPLQLKQMLVRMAGVDYDVENYEAEIRLCNARLRRMDKAIMQVNAMGGPYLVDEMGPMVDDFGRPQINPMAVQTVLYSPGAEIMPESDNMVVHMEFWKDQLMAEAAKNMPDPFRVAVFRGRMMEQAQGAAAMQAAGNELAVKAAAPVGEADAGAKDAEFERQEKSKDGDSARQIAVHKATQPQITGPPTASAPALARQG